MLGRLSHALSLVASKDNPVKNKEIKLIFSVMLACIARNTRHRVSKDGTCQYNDNKKVHSLEILVL